MKKPNVTQLIKAVQTGLKKHSPEILTGLGIAGMVTTTVLAVKATPKALQLIEDFEYDKGESLTAAETVRTTWKCYIPAVATCAASTACLIGASSVNLKRNAALATAYKLSETAFTEYRDKVVETIGEKKEQVVKEKIAKEKIEKDPVSKADIIITEKGNTLCYDAAIGRYFKSDIEKIKKAVNEVNREMTYNMYVSLNEFYDELGLPQVELGDELGWNMDEGLVDVSFTSQIADDGTPCIVMNYSVAPRYDFARLM